ncbi:cadherin domain-containing protein [Microvirga thermotolerans]|uniref:Cadherin domain-containing protein n=1 Tax=Microvirga thermotolerans TaxID=2651334 RepID=A0A5P9JW09_9HYPH|nr:cadherin domain-containing protein [Microvirga thermotolerans]QFU16623.1 hypothetical protein GDR74_10495 [Microvirga thermotolerans]
MAIPTGFKIGTTSVTDATTHMLAERTTAGGDVAGLTIIDDDQPTEDTYTYSIVTDGTGATAANDAIYEIVRGQDGLSRLVVKAGVILDFETAATATHDLWIKATDGTDTVVKKVTMSLTNVNEAPIDIELAGIVAAGVRENSARGTEIGALLADDPDANDTFTFTLKDDAGGRFMLDSTGKRLLVADGSKLDYEAAASHQIKVEVKDAGGLTFEKTLTIAVHNAVDTFIGTARNDKLAGTESMDFLYGAAGNDKLYGLGGDDVLNGGAGKDMLYGGAGKDTFLFDSPVKKGQFDQVMDFNSADDTLQFSLSAIRSFKIKGLKAGKLNKKFFTVGDHAKDKNDFVYYNKKNGFVYLDGDGSGAHKGIEILKLKPGLKLTADDFQFV